MKVDDAIRNRRSIRKYADKVPGDKEIQKVIEAGVWAPSGLNNQPWKFKVIRDKEKKDGLFKYTSYGKVIRNAPVAICVFLDKKAMYSREKDTLAIGACIQNMLLQANGLGLGTCWLGEILNKKKGVEKYIGVDAGYELMAVVTLGYPGEEGRSTRKKLDNFILQ